MILLGGGVHQKDHKRSLYSCLVVSQSASQSIQSVQCQTVQYRRDPTNQGPEFLALAVLAQPGALEVVSVSQ